MVYRIRRFLFDGSRIVEPSSNSSGETLRICRSNASNPRPYQDFSILKLDREDSISEEGCSFIGEGYSLFGILGLPLKFDRSDVLCFYLVLDSDRSRLGRLRGQWIYRVNEVILIPIADDLQSGDDVIAEVKRHLGSGCFFYSVPFTRSESSKQPEIYKYFDLTQNTQDWHQGKPTQPDYLWNSSWVVPFLHASIDHRKWTVPLICGAIETFSMPIEDYVISLWIISRMSLCYCGTRFCTRGINDYGHSANFVESEQILAKERHRLKGKTLDDGDPEQLNERIETSFLMVRGSVPLFWSQSSLQVGHHRIRFPRSILLSSRPFVLHFKRLSSRYGRILPVSLLSDDKGEKELNLHYENLIKSFASFDHYRHAEHTALIDSSHQQPRQSVDKNSRTLANRKHLLQPSWSICVESPLPMILIHFDFHEHFKNVRNMSPVQFVTTYMLKHKDCLALTQFVHSNGHFLSRGQNIITKQEGVLRINCIDCLDRTNNVQSGISSMVLLSYQIPALFDSSQYSSLSNTILQIFDGAQRDCWARNGDSISKIYAGTGALVGKSRAVDVKRSISRVLQNSLFDTSKNVVIESLVLSFARIPNFGKRIAYHLNPKLAFGEEGVLKSLSHNVARFSESRPLRLSVSSWNINGDKDKATETNRFDLSGKTATLNTWLMSGPFELLAQMRNQSCAIRTTGFVDRRFQKKPIDIYAIGFQEICDITASSVVKASEANMIRWQEMIFSMINPSSSSTDHNVDNENGKRQNHEYVLIATDQLVGIGLFIYIRRELVHRVRHLHTTKVKTGFMNSVGNKGCVATRFCLYNSSLCFICAHFNAGQKEVDLRNEDYQSIMNRLSSVFKLPVMDHSYIFFFGDFNYRINLPRQDVLDSIKRCDYRLLLAADQLNLEKRALKIFNGFFEGPILFDPTYKYDYHCQQYDTSEKARIPSWCDRILWTRSHQTQGSGMQYQGDIVYYGRAELMTSDHRPVTGILDFTVDELDERCLLNEYINVRRSFPTYIVVLKYPAPCVPNTPDLLGSGGKSIHHTVGKAVSRQVCDKIVQPIGNRLRDYFVTSSSRIVKIYLAFLFSNEAKDFVEKDDGILTQDDYVFEKRLLLHTDPEELIRLEHLILFGEQRCRDTPTTTYDRQFGGEAERYLVKQDDDDDSVQMLSALDQMVLNDNYSVQFDTERSSSSDDDDVDDKDQSLPAATHRTKDHPAKDTIRKHVLEYRPDNFCPLISDTDLIKFDGCKPLKLQQQSTSVLSDPWESDTTETVKPLNDSNSPDSSSLISKIQESSIVSASSSVSQLSDRFDESIRSAPVQHENLQRLKREKHGKSRFFTADLTDLESLLSPPLQSGSFDSKQSNTTSKPSDSDTSVVMRHKDESGSRFIPPLRKNLSSNSAPQTSKREISLLDDNWSDPILSLYERDSCSSAPGTPSSLNIPPISSEMQLKQPPQPPGRRQFPH